MTALVLDQADIEQYDALGREYEALELQVKEVLATPVEQWGAEENNALLDLTGRQASVHNQRMALLKKP